MTSRVHHSLRPLLCVATGVALSLCPALAASVPPSNQTRAGSSPTGYETIPLGRGPGNRLCLAATVGGKKGLMIIDTGAGGTLLSEATYGFLRGKNAELARGLPKTAGFNWTKADVTVATDFTVGKTNLGTLPVLLVPNRYLYDQAIVRSEDTDRSYDGLMGEELLRHYNALVDCGRMVMHLNTDPAKKVSLGAAFAKAGWTAVPMEDVGKDFAVTCSIQGHPFRLLVDTGAPFTTVSRRLVDALHLDSQVISGLKMGLVATRAEEIGMSTVDGMQIGNYTVPRVHMVVSPQSFAEFGGKQEEAKGNILAGFLGGDALSANSAIVDVGNKTLYLRRGSSGR